MSERKRSRTIGKKKVGNDEHLVEYLDVQTYFKINMSAIKKRSSVDIIDIYLSIYL